MDQAEAELKEKQQRWDDKNKSDAKEEKRGKTEHQPPNISPMVPYTQEAYGGGLYGKDDEVDKAAAGGKLKGSDTQSADGPAQPTPPLKHQPPPSSGDRDIDITGQSYIQ